LLEWALLLGGHSAGQLDSNSASDWYGDFKFQARS
jgi:hypothetical protein